MSPDPAPGRDPNGEEPAMAVGRLGTERVSGREAGGSGGEARRPADRAARQCGANRLLAEPIHFWFDFISPFGYLASLRIDDLAARHGREALWHPLLLGVTVLQIMGLKPIPDTPLKGDYAVRELLRYQRRHGQVIGRDLFRPPMAPLPPARLMAGLLRLEPAQAKPFARAVLKAYWREGREIRGAEALQSIGKEAGIPAALLARAGDNELARDALRDEMDQAVARGVFGSPFVIVDDEPFFGVDKFELIDEWLARGGW
ncbi:MAG: 2-hydroxychromene-2-carboxylate isomerase [Pigmentiphaga sp.]